MANDLPVVLTIGGYDPSGGAGITADIETIGSLNCQAITLISCLTSQNTREFKLLGPVNSELFADQAISLLSDFKVDVIKIGLLGGSEIVKETKKILDRLEETKVVIDPIIEASSGGMLSDKATLEDIKEFIFPKSYLITPNLEEAKILSGKNNLSSLIEKFRSYTSQYFLIKDINHSDDQIVNHLYSNKELKKSWSIPKIQGSFHGTGCHLASSISCFLAHSKDLEEAIELAQQNTLNAIKKSLKIGQGQNILKSR